MGGAVILLVVLVVTAAIAVLYKSRDGRIRGAAVAPTVHGPEMATAETAPSSTSVVDAALAEIVPPSAARVTLVQFSTSFCTPCRATKRILGEIAQVVPGVVHLEIEAESHLEVVRALDIRRTPTTLILDSERRIVGRASGQPRRDEVMATLGRLLEPIT